MSHDDHSAVPAVYVCICGGCGKPLKRVLENWVWSPDDWTEDSFAIECSGCGAHTMAYRDFLEPQIVAKLRVSA